MNDTTGTRSSRTSAELRLPAVVVVARLAELHAVAVGLARERRRVALERRRGRRLGAPGTNRFTPNGPARQRARSSVDVLAHPSGRPVARREKAEPARLDTAAASAGVDGPPPIGACTIG